MATIERTVLRAIITTKTFQIVWVTFFCILCLFCCIIEY